MERWIFGDVPLCVHHASPMDAERGDCGCNKVNNSAYRNPDFNLTTSSSAHVDIGMSDANSDKCAGKLYWVGCAEYRASKTDWYVDLSTRRCWMNGGAYRTCSNVSTFDVWTIVLMEMLHVSALDHHANPDYSDAVSQEDPVAYPGTYWQNRSLRWADSSGLQYLYGNDPCTTPPCPLSLDS